jgi:hypothetical protein
MVPNLTNLPHLLIGQGCPADVIGIAVSLTLLLTG